MPKVRLKARCQKRRTPGKMTELEKRRARVLDEMIEAGQIQEYHFEAITLVLAKDLRYTPDFMVVDNVGNTIFDEVKPANWRNIPNQDKSTAKLKMAADKFPFMFRRVVETKNKSGLFELEWIEAR